MKEWGYDGVEEGKVPLEQVEVGLTGDLTGTGGDDAEIGVEHLATELVSIGINEDEVVGEVLGEDGRRDGHSNVTNADDRDLGVFLGGRESDNIDDGLEECLSEKEGVLENTSSTFVLDAEEVKGTVQSSKKNSP
ncbi:uncharacterized protein HKW66_Vig0147990 [Vigna angularis]|uniref:Uncharacterized protein n=1 Tax=Phaseolus angularis TaxID=3914 RepID=A0A8T0JW46_PHAAN|nr:uncharacterized protein HKW66_Vig0147990 [Vigna angularis]